MQDSNMENLKFHLELCPPHWGGGHIIFAFSAVRRPASHLVSRHFRQQFLSYLYQIWHAGLLG